MIDRPPLSTQVARLVELLDALSGVRVARDAGLRVLGDPARVSCHGGAVRSVATRGEISLLPVGTADECLQDDPTEAVNLRLPRALLRLDAEELDLDPDRAAFEPRFCFRDRAIENIVWAQEGDRSGRWALPAVCSTARASASPRRRTCWSSSGPEDVGVVPAGAGGVRVHARTACTFAECPPCVGAQSPP